MSPEKNDMMLEFELTEEDKKRIDEIEAGIDLENSVMVLQYGTSCQQKIDTFSASILNNVRNIEIGKIGELISELTEDLKEKPETGRKRRQKKAEKDIDQVTALLYDYQNQLLEETIRLKKLFRMNREYYKDLTLYIMAGQNKLENNKTGMLSENFSKKLHDLEVSRLICIQMSAQLEIILNDYIAVGDNIQAVLKNTIPLWRNRITSSERKE